MRGSNANFRRHSLGFDVKNVAIRDRTHELRKNILMLRIDIFSSHFRLHTFRITHTLWVIPVHNFNNNLQDRWR